MINKVLKHAFLFAITVCLFSCNKEIDESLLLSQSSENNILSFNLLQSDNDSLIDEDRLGTINEENRTVEFILPFGSDITAVIPQITISEDATLLPESGVVQDFTNPVIYTVTAADGSESRYTITINLPELSERQALINIYNTTFASSLPDPDYVWDLTAQDMNDWFGVTAEGEKVIALDFDSDFSLNLTSDVKNLIHLEKFISVDSSVTLVDELGSLTSLKAILLELTSVANGLGWIENLTNLESLILYDNFYRNYDINDLDVSNLEKLITLSIELSNLSSIPESINKLTALTSLTLGENSITALPDDLSGLVSLKTLRLSDNRISNISAITQLTNLEVLSLNGNTIITIPAGISDLTKLTSLGLSNNSSISDISPILELIDLEVLTLSTNAITEIPAEISNLTKLTSLNLSNNPSISNISPIMQLTNLELLFMSGNSITSVPQQIGNLSKLRSLFLADNAITRIPTTIGSLGELKTLSFSNNMIGNAGVPEELGRLTGLSSLFLTGNTFTIVPQSICNLRDTGTRVFLTSAYFLHISYILKISTKK